MDIKDFEKIVKIAKKAGITRLKIDGNEIEFSEQTIKPKKRRANDVAAPIQTEREFSEMDTLMWSVAGNAEG